MKKTTLTKKLANYSALTVAMAGVADASGQIVYNDFADHFGAPGVTFFVDMDDDGIDEFNFGQWNNFAGDNYTFFNTSFPYTYATAPGNPGDVVGGMYRTAFNAGDVISSGDTWDSGLNYTGVLGIYNTLGQFCNGNGEFCGAGGDQYLGVRFSIGANTHYGWIRVEAFNGNSFWTVKDAAYNSTPDAPINAGQTLGVNDVAFGDSIKVVTLNKSIAISNLEGNANYNLFSITGQSIMQGEITNNSHVIEANGVANGIYILELIDEQTNARITKKVLL